MGLFKKKLQPVVTELKCPAEGCSFTSDHAESLKRHVDWKHPELAQNVEKSQKVD